MNTKIFALVLFFVLGAGTKLGYSQRIDLSGVTSIEVNIACQLVLVQGKEPNMELVGDEKTLAAIETKIKGGKLVIKSDLKRQRKEDVVVKIEVENLEHLGIGGAVDMKTIRTLNFPNFTLNVSGVGNIEMELVSNNFKLNSSGVTNLRLAGSANDARMAVSGVGNISASNFLIQNAEVENSGVGRVRVNAVDRLRATVSGIGSISYEGDPLVSSNISGIGRISRN